MAVKKDKIQLPPKIKPMGVFDIINNINEGARGKNLFDNCKADKSEDVKNEIEKLYNSFIINRGFSNFQDTVLLVNEMNKYPTLPTKMQYDFLRHIIRPCKRFAKWGKAGDDSKDVQMLIELYQYSSVKAREALTLLSEDQLVQLRKRVDHGGR